MQFHISILAVVLTFGSIVAAEPGHDLAYALTRVDDPNADVRQSVLDVCRMTSAAGVKTIETFLAADPKTPSADSRRQLEQIVKQQHAARKILAAKSTATAQWIDTITSKAYERVGTNNDVWNDTAKDAIKLWYSFNATVEEQQRLSADMRTLSDQKCTDPLVFFLYTLWGKPRFAERVQQITPHFLKAAQKMESSNYPPSLKILAYGSYLSAYATQSRYPDQPIGPGPKETVEHFRDAIFAQMPSAIKDDKMDENDLYADLLDCQNAEMAVGISRKDAADQIADNLKTVLGPDSPVLNMWEGDFLINYAWDARGGGWASTVKQDQWKLFGDRLSAASDALQAAWTKDPQSLRGKAAERMLTISMAQGGDDDRELWFQRALEANPDNVNACFREVDAVDPRWSGDNGGKLFTLARMFELSGNEQAEIPLAVGYVYTQLAHSTIYSDGSALNRDFMKRPDIWATISRIYGPFLDRHPGNRYARDRYILYSAITDHWDVVGDQIDKLDGYPDPDLFSGYTDDYNKMWKVLVAHRTKPPATKQPN